MSGYEKKCQSHYEEIAKDVRDRRQRVDDEEEKAREKGKSEEQTSGAVDKEKGTSEGKGKEKAKEKLSESKDRGKISLLAPFTACKADKLPLLYRSYCCHFRFFLETL